ncbi:hypothetical protein LOK74_09095 [Brevibacillus humidisoli]|uniref:hypothetical protein n=1 Tax=Brevibacillus humidisoli TaxID=2895522 RepID=UPI001E4C645E|nr:hypothetical protein [Brevibacillus humidisoli]UFJ42628.1 hypothetical protein LOK74_09095 [Brevibacillus humidisoli]
MYQIMYADMRQGADAMSAAPVVKSLAERLQHLVDIGLDYLTLDRETDTLSGGESQCVKMVKHLSGSLVDVTYIFDEPSVGLHPRDVHRLNGLLQKLRDKGNTVIVVEHDPDVIKVADHIVDVGPYADSRGGTIVYEGSFQGLLESGTLTVVTGVAGSGKSTLINEVFLSQHPDAIVIDQSAVACQHARIPRPTRALWMMCARRLLPRTRSTKACSASTPRELARTAKGWGLCIQTLHSSTA